MCCSLFLIKLYAFKHRCFNVNIEKFLRTAFFIKHIQRRLLYQDKRSKTSLKGAFIQWNLWIADTYGLNKIRPLLRGVRYWEVILKRSSHLGLNVLSAIQCMYAVWDVRYWGFSPYLEIDWMYANNSTRNYITPQNLIVVWVIFWTIFARLVQTLLTNCRSQLPTNCRIHRSLPKVLNEKNDLKGQQLC